MIVIKKPTESELHLAAHVGILRTIFALRTNLPGRYGCEDDGFASHVNGAIGEMMLAKHRDRFWSGTIGTTKAVADVGRCYQVRTTEHRSGKLIVHPDDSDNQPFVLARILLPEVHLVGWLWGSEAKLPGFWREDVRYPAFFASGWHDLDTLPDEATVKARA